MHTKHIVLGLTQQTSIMAAGIKSQWVGPVAIWDQDSDPTISLLVREMGLLKEVRSGGVDKGTPSSFVQLESQASN